MQYKTITYQRVKNLGNYNTERMEMTVELDEDDNVLICAKELRLNVNYLLHEPVSEKLPPTPPTPLLKQEDDAEVTDF
jgi:hypothetical protein